MNEEYIDEDYPCNSCTSDCDEWEAQFCCKRCHYIFGDDTSCEDCDPMDI